MNPVAWILGGRALADVRGPIRFLVFCLVIFGIPLGLGSVARDELQRIRLHDLIEFRKSELENRVGNFSQWVPDLLSFDRVLLAEWQRVSRQPDPISTFARWRSQLQRWFPRAIAMEFIDHQGKRRPELSDNVLSDSLLRRLHEDSDQTDYLRGQSLLEKHLDDYRKELGPLLGRFSGKIMNRIEQLNINARWIASLITTVKPFGQAIFLFRESRCWSEMVSSFRLELLRQRYPDMAVAGVDLRLPLASQTRSLGSARRWVAELLRDPEANGGAPVVMGAWVMAQIPIQRQFRAVFALPLYGTGSTSKPSFEADSRIRMLGVVAFLLLCGCGWRWFFSSAHPFLSLQWKIGLLLLYVVGLPLGLLGLAAGNSLREYRSLLEQRLWIRQERALRELEDGFMAAQGRMEAAIHRDLGQTASNPAGMVPDLLNRVGRLHQTFSPQFCEIVNDKGRPLTTAFINQGSNLKPLLGMFQSFSSRVIADLNHGLGRSLSAKEQLMTATGEMIGVNVDLMYAAISRFLGELSPVQIGPDLYRIFMQPIYDSARIARQIVVMGWDDKTLPLDYIQEVGMPVLDRTGEIELWMSMGRKNILFSEGMPFRDEVLRVLPRVRSEPRPVRWKLSASGKLNVDGPTDEELLGEVGVLRIEHSKKNSSGKKKQAKQEKQEKLRTFTATTTLQLQGGWTFICTARKGAGLQDFSLVAFSTDERIQAELDLLRGRFGMVAVVFLAMALAASRLLAGRFLVPVKDLSVGVKALQERTFSHRIPIRNDDELGKLSQTFNGMIEGLKDLEIARLVQESFFPAVPLERENWTVSGSCQPASRVGGDYLDFFPIGENRLGLVIGDVSGHGVGAALVVGMAKALMSSPSMVLEPAAILERMQRVFLSTLKRKKMMSCCVVMFEPDSGRLWAANAGHNLPYLVRSDGRVEQLKPGGKPLGTKNKPFVVQEERLGPDDWLFMYTDGFIEAAHIHGGDFGYDRVGEALPGLRCANAKETETALRAWFESQAAPGPQADDITILVLQRMKPHGDTVPF